MRFPGGAGLGVLDGVPDELDVIDEELLLNDVSAVLELGLELE